MNIKYLFIDTNNFIEPLEGGFKQTQIGLEDLQELNKLIETRSLNLLLPECTLLEVKRLVIEKSMELKESFATLQSNKTIESTRVKNRSGEFFKILLKEEEEILDKVSRLLNEIFRSSSLVFIELNEKIYLNAYRRGLLGKKPFNKEKQKTVNNRVIHSVSPDVLAIESVKYFFVKNAIKNHKLIICSRDSDWREEDGTELDPQIRNEFKESKLYTTLRECLRSEYSIDLPPIDEKLNDEDINLELDKQPKPPVPIEILIEELKKSGSFDAAQKNMGNLLNMKRYLKTNHLRKILKAMFSNPYNYTINQVMAVDVGEEFSKKLYLVFKEEIDIWKEFADDLLLHYGDKYQYLEDYDWLFKRLGIDYKKKTGEDDIPF